jgi:hypothetical protein
MGELTIKLVHGGDKNYAELDAIMRQDKKFKAVVNAKVEATEQLQNELYKRHMCCFWCPLQFFSGTDSSSEEAVRKHMTAPPHAVCGRLSHNYRAAAGSGCGSRFINQAALDEHSKERQT